MMVDYNLLPNLIAGPPHVAKFVTDMYMSDRIETGVWARVRERERERELKIIWVSG